MNPRRHQNNTKTFEELTFEEQAKAMNMNALQFRKQLHAHLRRANGKGRPRWEVLKSRLNLLRSIIDAYADQEKGPTIRFRVGNSAEPQTAPSNPVITELATPISKDTFICSKCQIRHSVREAIISADGLNLICDSCYLSNLSMGDGVSTLVN